MKKLIPWMITAIIVFGGMTMTTSCTDQNDDKTTDQIGENRQEFLNHVKNNMKFIAENLNFGSWHMANGLNIEFNKEVLHNPEFEKTIIPLFNQKIRESIQPLSPGSELAESGYKYQATVDFSSFNYRFTQRLDR